VSIGVSHTTIRDASWAGRREPAAIRLVVPFTVNVDWLASGGLSAAMFVVAAAIANAARMRRIFIST